MHYLVGTLELIGMKKTLKSVKGLLISYLMIEREIKNIKHSLATIVANDGTQIIN